MSICIKSLYDYKLVKDVLNVKPFAQNLFLKNRA